MLDSNLLCTLISTNNFSIEEVHHLLPITPYIHLKSIESLEDFSPTSEFVLLFTCDRVGCAELEDDNYSTGSGVRVRRMKVKKVGISAYLLVRPGLGWGRDWEMSEAAPLHLLR